VVGIGLAAPERNARGSKKRLRAWAASRRHFALSTAVANRVISLAHVLGRPVRNAAGTRIGRVSDIVVRWDAGGEYPPVTGVLIRVRGANAVVQQADVTYSTGPGVGDYTEQCAVLSAVTSTPARRRSMIEESAVPTLSSNSQPIPLMKRGSS
jgi:sporulation protein YlmC with PRC-barrel domain